MVFEPIILAFCCHFCAYAAADLAGSMRLSYPANVLIIQIPCSGRIKTIHLLRAFQYGADGVLVAGCREGECHFRTGNFRARRKVERVKEILDDLGLGADRVAMYNLSASMGPRFTEIAQEMTARIKELGPNPLSGSRPGENVAAALRPMVTQT
ncbi:MAG: hydrogenase iron-sulfur subunit [Desulfobacca sp.]|nr:hydrogenase iron-sulfur subunit [Desulfobacca sp.]